KGCLVIPEQPAVIGPVVAVAGPGNVDMVAIENEARPIHLAQRIEIHAVYTAPGRRRSAVNRRLTRDRASTAAIHVWVGAGPLVRHAIVVDAGIVDRIADDRARIDAVLDVDFVKAVNVMREPRN